MLGTGILGDHDLLDLRAAFDDRHDPRVPKMPLDGTAGAYSLTAMHLDRVTGDPIRHAGGEVLGDQRRLGGRWATSPT